MSKLAYLGVIAAAFFLLLFVGRAWKLKPETAAAHTIHRGEIVTLASTNLSTVWLAADSDDAYAFQTAMLKGDTKTLEAAEKAGKAIAVAAGSQARVLAESVSRRQVVVLDGAYAGKSGWVEYELLRLRAPAAPR